MIAERVKKLTMRTPAHEKIEEIWDYPRTKPIHDRYQASPYSFYVNWENLQTHIMFVNVCISNGLKQSFKLQVTDELCFTSDIITQGIPPIPIEKVPM